MFGVLIAECREAILEARKLTTRQQTRQAGDIVKGLGQAQQHSRFGGHNVFTQSGKAQLHKSLGPGGQRKLSGAELHRDR